MRREDGRKERRKRETVMRKVGKRKETEKTGREGRDGRKKRKYV